MFLNIPHIHITTFTKRACKECGNYINISLEGNKGVPDLTIFLTKGTLFVELKVGKNRLTKAQEHFRDNLPSKYIYKVARSFEEFKKIIDENKV